MRIIDLASWPRASQYDFFRGVANPHFGITASVNATHLMDVLKPAGVSIFNAALFAIMRAANACPELRTRFRIDEVVEHDIVHPSATVPLENDQFAFCDVDFSADWSTFDAACKTSVAAAKKQTQLVDHVAQLDDRIYLTCVPWIAFSNLTHPVDGPDDCIPRIAWGRMTRDGATWCMPVAIQAHHALVDGRHVGQFYSELEKQLAKESW